MRWIRIAASKRLFLTPMPLEKGKHHGRICDIARPIVIKFLPVTEVLSLRKSVNTCLSRQSMITRPQMKKCRSTISSVGYRQRSHLNCKIKLTCSTEIMHSSEEPTDFLRRITWMVSISSHSGFAFHTAVQCNCNAVKVTCIFGIPLKKWVLWPA